MNFQGPYCLLHKEGRTFLATGRILQPKLLADIPRPRKLPVISMVPYAQLRERGLLAHHDGETIIALECDDYRELDAESLVGPQWDAPVVVEGPISFNLSDEDFMTRVFVIRHDVVRVRRTVFSFGHGYIPVSRNGLALKHPSEGHFPS